MVVTGSNATFRTAAAAETSDTAVKDLPLSEEDGYTAYLLFTDKDWEWGNWDPQKDGGWGHDAIITGDGTYTVSIDREGYKKYLEGRANAATTPGSIKAANGVNCFMVDFKKMATAQNFDISNMKVKDVTIKCDGKVFPSDTSKMYFGDIESKNNLRLEIRNEYGYSGSFKTKEEFDPDEEFTFSDSLSVTFTLEGIQKGTTLNDVCYLEDGTSVVWNLDQWNEDPTVKPTAGTVRTPKPAFPTYTKIPAEEAKDLPLSEEDGYKAFLMFTDKDWEWGNWNANDDGGWGKDAVITGDGTYTVSIDREGYKKYLEEKENATTTPGGIVAANGAYCFLIDFKEMAKAQNFDISNMKVKDVTIKCDGTVFPSDASKMYFGDIEGRNNLRLEVCNAFGYSKGEFETQDVFDPKNNFTFSDSLSVTFTLEGIEKGNSLESLFYDNDGEKIVRTLEQWNLYGESFVPTAKPEEQPGEREIGKYIDQDLWNTKGIHAYLFFQTSTWDYRNHYEPFFKAGRSKSYEYIYASGKEAPETAKANDVLLTKDGEYTVSIDGVEISGFKYQMLGLAMDLLATSYPGVKITNTSITVDGINIMQSPENPDTKAVDLCQKQDFKYYTFVAINTWDKENQNTEKYPMSGRNEKGELKMPKKSISMTFTVTGLEKALKDIENKTYVDPQTGKTLQQEEEEAAPTKRPENNIQPTTEPENTVKPTNSPVATKKPDSTKRPSKSPAPTLEPTETPEASAEPTLQPGDEPTAEPSNSPTATPSNTPAASKDPGNQTISQPTAAPVLKTTPAPTAKAYGEVADEGEELEDNSGVTYTVTKTGNKAEVEYSAPKENAKGTVKIPDKVTINGVSYKVTSVADNAFKNNDKIKKVVINKNITSIGKNAFSGCKNLKTITITSTKLTSSSISKNAFKGISGKVVIKVPKGMKKKYKKLFRAKGLSKKVRIV